jgi:hypothetical protein
MFTSPSISSMVLFSGINNSHLAFVPNKPIKIWKYVGVEKCKLKFT